METCKIRLADVQKVNETREALQDHISEYNIAMGHEKVPRPQPLVAVRRREDVLNENFANIKETDAPVFNTSAKNIMAAVYCWRNTQPGVPMKRDGPRVQGGVWPAYGRPSPWAYT